MEGNREKALAIAREAVRLLEGRGIAKLAGAREALAQIEAGLVYKRPDAAPFLTALNELLKLAKDAEPERGLAAIDTVLEEARRESVPSQEFVGLLARCIVCWNAEDFVGSDQSLQQAEEALGRVGQAERSALAVLLESCKAQRAAAIKAGQKESDRLYAEAAVKAQAGDTDGALVLLEASLAAARQEGNVRQGGVHPSYARPCATGSRAGAGGEEETVGGSGVAQEAGDEELLRAVREDATVVAAMAEEITSEAAAQGNEDVSK